MRVEVKGAEQLDKVARVLVAKGNPAALKRRMTKPLKETADSIGGAQKRSLAAGLPKRGGAAATVSAGTRTVVSADAARAIVTLAATWPGHDLTAIDAGALWHPVFGNRERRTVTRVRPRLLTAPFLKGARTAPLRIHRETDLLAEEIARET